jgi:glycosyltransferase domain-containing protein
MTPEEVELLSELTIVIPTYNRPLELERAIEYWRDLPVTVHILDGSEKPWFPVGNLIGDSPAIFYHHLPNESEYGFYDNYCERINMGLSLVNSKFSALIADDDFFTLSGLTRALKTLNDHTQIDSVIGRVAFFKKNTYSLQWEKESTNWIPSKNLQSGELIERLKTNPRKFFIWYGISRTDKLKAIWSTGSKFSFSSRILYEYSIHQLGLAFCRVRVIDSVLQLREKVTTINPYIEERHLTVDRDEEYKVVCQLYKETFSKIDPLLDDDTLNELALSRADWLFDLLAYKERPKIEKTPLKAHQRLIITLRKYLRNTVLSLPPSVLGLLYLIKPEIRSQIENHTPLIFDEREFFEKLLLTPREELRLRSNI